MAVGLNVSNMHFQSRNKDQMHNLLFLYLSNTHMANIAERLINHNSIRILLD